MWQFWPAISWCVLARFPFPDRTHQSASQSALSWAVLAPRNADFFRVDGSEVSVLCTYTLVARANGRLLWAGDRGASIRSYFFPPIWHKAAVTHRVIKPKDFAGFWFQNDSSLTFEMSFGALIYQCWLCGRLADTDAVMWTHLDQLEKCN